MLYDHNALQVANLGSQVYGGLQTHGQVINAGRVPVGAGTALRVEVKNIGTSNQMLESVSTSCGCEEVDFQPAVLCPGQTGTATTRLHNTVGAGRRRSKIWLIFRDLERSRSIVPLRIQSYFARGTYVTPSLATVRRTATSIRRRETLASWTLQTDAGNLPAIRQVTPWPTWLKAEFGRETSASSNLTILCGVSSAPAGTAPGLIRVELADGKTVEVPFLLELTRRSKLRPASFFVVDHIERVEQMTLPDVQFAGASLVTVLSCEGAPWVPTFNVEVRRDGVVLLDGVLRTATDPLSRFEVLLSVVDYDGVPERAYLYYLVSAQRREAR